MKELKFNNLIFYWAIVSILVVLLLWNVYLTVVHAKLVGLLPIMIQGVLLVLILKRHVYAKSGVKFWAILFLITGAGLQFLGRLLKDITNGFINTDLQFYLTTGLTILIGIAIVVYVDKTVEIVAVTEEKAESSNC